jgi:hypothetical protein
MSICEIIQALSDEQNPAWVSEDLKPLSPARISFDFYPASAISVRMLHERGHGIGRRKSTVVHAIADREVKAGRVVRQKGQALCLAKFRDQRSEEAGTPVTCERCLKMIQGQGLVESIRFNHGAWME